MRRLATLLPAVRPRERARFAFFFALGAGLALAQTLGLTAAEGIFLSRVGAGRLPWLYVVASLATMVASLLYALRLGRARNDRVWIELLAISTLLGVGCGAAAWARLPGSAESLLCVQIAAQSIVGSHFWELAGDVFDRLAAKRIGPTLTAGASLGAAGGGAFALALADRFPVESLVAVWAVLLAGLSLWVYVGRAWLRRWSPLGAEQDAHSLPRVRAAARYLAVAPLGRWLLLSGVAMVVSVLIARFLWSGVLAREFEDERSLTSFLALWLTVTNVAQIALPIWIGPWLVQRLGVPTANLLHPVLTLATSLGLTLAPTLPIALGARASGELIENAFASPVRNLVGEALPARFQARVSAFLSGVVANAAMALAGAALLVGGAGARASLAALAAGFAGLYLLGHLGVRRLYVRSIVSELRAGRLDLRHVGGELGRRELAELSAMWERWLGDEGERALRPITELAALFATRGALEPLRAGLRHGSARVRATCLDALRGCAPESASDRIALCVDALSDGDADVRRAALAALPDDDSAAGEPDTAPGLASRVVLDAVLERELSAALRARLSDPDPRVRALAALRAGEAGAEVLRAMTRAGAAVEAVPALDALPQPLASEAAPRLLDPDDAVRAAALRCAARHPAGFGDAAAALGASVSHPDADVRCAAIEAVAASDLGDATGTLARALVDPSAEVRGAAGRGLVRRQIEGRLAVARWLESDAPLAATEAAIDVVGASADPDARAALVAQLRARARDAWNAVLSLPLLAGGDSAPLRLLRAAQHDASVRAVRLLFRTLAQLEDPEVVRTVERTLRFGPERLRLDALEVLSQLGDGFAAAQFVLLFEPTPIEEKLRQLPGGLARPRSLDELCARLANEGTRWQRLAARAGARAADAFEPDKENWMERLVFLRQVPIFANLTLDQLEAVEKITREEEYVEEEEIVREGDPGDELFLVVEGEVTVWRGLREAGPVRLNTLGAGSYFGEMAILDSEGRSASIVATRATRCLVLDGMRLRELILDEPEIAFEIFKVLTARVRAAEARLAPLTPPT